MTYSNEDFYRELFEKSLEALFQMGKLLTLVDLNPSNSPHLINSPYFKAALAEVHGALDTMKSLPEGMKLEKEEMGERSDGTPYVSKQVYASAYQRITVWYAEDGHVTKRLSEKLN